MGVRLEQFSQVVASIHRAALDPRCWSDSLVATAQLLGACKAGIFELDAPSLALRGTLARAGHDEAVQRAYEQHYYLVDPTMPLGLAQPALTPLMVYEHFDKRARSRSEYFEFARKSGFGDTIGFSTADIAARRFIFTLHRPFDARAFDGTAKRLMQEIARHFQIAQAVSVRLAELHAANTAMAAALDDICAAAFVVDGAGRIRHANAAASELLGRCPAVLARSGALSLAEPRANARLHAALRRAACEHGQSSALNLSIAGPDDAELLVAPLEPRDGKAWPEPLAFVAILRGKDDVRSIGTRLRELYGLTAAEAHVAAMVALGDTVSEIAGRLGVTEPTLRTQLQSIFAKTGTRRQADVVRLALRGTLIRGFP